MSSEGERLQAEGDDGDVRVALIAEGFKTARTAIRVIGGVAVAYFAFAALKAIGGQNTAVSVAVSLILDAFVELKFVLAISLAGACTAWAIGERRLRYRKVEQMQRRIIVLETGIDPNRTSTGLTPAGRTNPRDRRP
jgi:hypothetical protein